SSGALQGSCGGSCRCGARPSARRCLRRAAPRARRAPAGGARAAAPLVSLVFDTSILIDVLRKDPAALDYVGRVRETPSCSEVTRIEITRGLRSSERAATDELYRSIRWVPVDESISRRAGELGRRWDRSRPGISLADLVIAA